MTKLPVTFVQKTFPLMKFQIEIRKKSAQAIRRQDQILKHKPILSLMSKLPRIYTL